jgi:phosphonate transport system substrate-binding protein
MKWITLLLLCLTISSSHAGQTLRFTAIPDQDTTRLQERFGAIATYLSGKLGVAVEYIPVKSYAASVQAFKNNEVQLAWFGGLSGVQARRAVPGSKAIAQGQEDLAFVSYFIAHSSTGLKESKEFPEGIRGKTFTFGSKGSTSGRLMPEYYLRKHLGDAPDKVFARHGFSGDHSKTIALVQSGAFLVGALNYQVWDTELKEGKIDTSKVSIIWRTPTYPDYNWSIRGDVEGKYGKGFIGRVQQALLQMEDRALLDRFPRTKFVAADNSMYGPILSTGTAIGLLEE